MYSGIIVFIIFPIFACIRRRYGPENSRRERMLHFPGAMLHTGPYDNKGAAPENSMATFRLAVERGLASKRISRCLRTASWSLCMIMI